MINIIKGILDKNKKAWDSKLKLAIWVDRVIVKKAIGFSPFDLVYSIQERLPQNNLLQMYKFFKTYDNDIDDDMQLRVEP